MSISFLDSNNKLNTTVTIGYDLYTTALIKESCGSFDQFKYENFDPNWLTMSDTEMVQHGGNLKVDPRMMKLLKDTDKLAEISAKLKTQVNKVSVILQKGLAGKVKTIHKPLSFNQFFYHQFEDIINSIYLVFPDDQELDQLKQKMKYFVSAVCYANHSYINQDEIRKQVKEFFQFTEKTLKLHGELDEKKISYYQNLTQLFEECLVNIDLLKMPLFFYTDKDFYKISNNNTLRFNISIQLLKDYLKDTISSIYSRFINFSYDYQQDNAQNLKSKNPFIVHRATFLVNKVMAVREKILPILRQYISEDISTVLNNLDNIKEVLYVLRNLFEGFKNQKDKSVYTMSPEPQIKTFSSMDKQLIGSNRSCNLHTGDEVVVGSCKDIDDALKYYRDQFKWQHICSCFITNPIDQIFKVILPGLTDWKKERSGDKHFSTLLKLISPPKVEEKILPKPKEIHLYKPKKKKTHQPVQQSSSQQNAEEPEIEESVPEIRFRPIETKEQNLNTETLPTYDAFSKEERKIISLITNLIASLNQNTPREARDALQEVLMNVIDLSGIKQLIDKGEVDSSSYNLVMIQHIMTVHQVMEQALRYRNILKENDTNILQFNHHNLKGLYRQLSDTQVPAMIHQFYLANFWVNYAYEQQTLCRVTGEPVPLLLKKTITILSENKDHEIEKIPATIEKVFSFITELLVTDSGNTTKKEWRSTKLTPTDKIRTESLKAIQTSINDLEKKIPLMASSCLVDRFKTVKSDLDLLEEEIAALNGTIDSMRLSHKIRFIQWKQGRIVEQLCQIILEMKKGIITQEHNVRALLEKMEDKIELKKESLEFLKHEYSRNHKSSRNPYQEIDDNSIWHLLVLDAEQIRENPILALGWTSNAVKKRDLSYDKILLEIASHFEKTNQIILNELLEALKKVLP